MELLNWQAVDTVIGLALDEDIGSGDITTESLVPPGLEGVGQIRAKKACVVAGLFLVGRVYQAVDPRVCVKVLVDEGKKVESGHPLCQVEGPYASLLKGERVVLNFLQRLCGIASAAHRAQRSVRHTRCRVLDTRKTTPGLRDLEKYAVRCGGASNHRMGLYDAFLVKENHVAAAGSIERAIRAAKKAHPDLPLEVEVRNTEELVLAVEYGADIVLLDNMSLLEISRAAKMVGSRVILEVSGGVTQCSLKAIAETGVHRVSLGALTHSVVAADLSMLIWPRTDLP
jgi:nicotinate-nucleotide pyrophosphorylase (carboxylating)